MNICDGTKEKEINPTPKAGHIYYCHTITIAFGKLAIMVKEGKDYFLVSLATGEIWTRSGSAPYHHNYSWEDVTDSYCLQKVK